MAKYNVEIIETLSRVVEVEAESEDDAVEIVENMYYDEEIILDADDFAGADFNIYGY